MLTIGFKSWLFPLPLTPLQEIENYTSASSCPEIHPSICKNNNKKKELVTFQYVLGVLLSTVLLSVLISTVPRATLLNTPENVNDVL